jgi:hypothetical protein
LARTVNAAKAAAETARTAQKRATELAQEAVTRLQGEHWSIRDIARVTGVSFQRVHQVLNEAKAAGRTAAQTRAQVRRYPQATAVEDHGKNVDASRAPRQQARGKTHAPGKKNRAGV